MLAWAVALVTKMQKQAKKKGGIANKRIVNHDCIINSHNYSFLCLISMGKLKRRQSGGAYSMLGDDKQNCYFAPKNDTVLRLDVCQIFSF
ncbi:hypothetical protein VXS03_02210 [Photobacterium sp. S4TG1]|uniref:hypothetical protein n=1 Tax=Photobacterium sp. S4TG1 TaxID=3114587 RepID=UPI002E19E08E|nr:hypothetical protein [Photobacterium sp. S4TG1]